MHKDQSSWGGGSKREAAKDEVTKVSGSPIMWHFVGVCRTLAFTLIKQEPAESLEQRNSKVHFIFYNDHFNCGDEDRL